MAVTNSGANSGSQRSCSANQRAGRVSQPSCRGARCHNTPSITLATAHEVPSHNSGFHHSPRTSRRWSCTDTVAINTQNSAHATSQPARLRACGGLAMATVFMAAGVAFEMPAHCAAAPHHARLTA